MGAVSSCKFGYVRTRYAENSLKTLKVGTIILERVALSRLIAGIVLLVDTVTYMSCDG